MTSSQETSPSRTGSDPRQAPTSRNPFVWIGTFIRQVIAELRKVVIPTPREMGAYTATVLGFVFVMILIVFGLDIAFGWLARLAFTTSGS